MKKRKILALLLSCSMILSNFTGFSSAAAEEKDDGNVHTVTAVKALSDGGVSVPASTPISDEILKKNVKANSEQSPAEGNDGPAEWAFDDEYRWWHSRWKYDAADHEVESGEVAEGNPIWIQTGFDKVEYVKEITYLPRQDQAYGRIHAYEVQIANLEDPTTEPNDNDFKIVKSGELLNQKEESKITLDSLEEATHIRLVAKSVYTGAGSAHVAAQRIKIYAATLMSIEVTEPTKKEYKINENLNLDGMQVIAHYSDNTTKNVTNEIEVNGFDSTTAGEKTITVAYGGKTESFIVTVRADEKPPVTQISDAILKENAKANSEQNPAEGHDGPATYAFDDEAHWWHSRWKGTSAENEVSNGEVSDNNSIWIQTGFGKVEYIKELTYLPRQDAQPYGRINAYEVQIANLENPTDMPTDADFTKVKEGNLQNQKQESTITLDSPTAATHIRLVAKSVYTNSLPNVEGDPQADYPGSPHVAAQRIKIYAVEPISLAVTAGKTEYFVGDELDKAQMSATLTFSDGSTVDVMENVAITGFDTSAPAETQEVTVTYNAFSYGEFTDTFTVTVKEKEKPPVTLTGITVTEPTKTKYKIGETFDSEGMVVTATYSDSTTEDVTAKAEVTGFDSTTAGEKTITVTYQEKTATFTVIVEKGLPEDLVGVIQAAKDAAEKAEAAKKAAEDALRDAQTQAAEAKAKAEAAKADAQAAADKAAKAETAKTAAETAQAAAEEAARQAAENAGATEADRQAAEAAKEAAEAAKTAAEAAKAEAAAAKTEAETAKTAAETAQSEADKAKKAAESAQAKAEIAKKAAEDAAKAAAQSEENALEAKVAAEAAQKKAEDAQKAAKDDATAAEEANKAAGTAQNEAESSAEKAEIAQKLADAQAKVATKAAGESKAYAEKAIAAQKAAEEAAKRAEEARKEAEEELKRVQEEAEKKLAALRKILEETTKARLQKCSDFKAGSWYEDYVVEVYLRGYMTGMDSNYFGVNEPLVRAQFAVILYRMAGEPEVEFKDTFADVKEGEFYSDAVVWANEQEIITGYEDSGLFGPNDKITREQMATIMYRYAKTLEDKELSKNGKLDDFPDAESVQEFAKEALAWCVEEEIITGKTVGDEQILAPQGNALRAECAAVIARFSNWVDAE